MVLPNPRKNWEDAILLFVLYGMFTFMNVLVLKSAYMENTKCAANLVEFQHIVGCLEQLMTFSVPSKTCAANLDYFRPFLTCYDKLMAFSILFTALHSWVSFFVLIDVRLWQKERRNQKLGRCD